MMVQMTSSEVIGVDALPVKVEVDAQVGIPGFHIVGLASAAVAEGRVRIRSALENTGYQLKSKRITVNLAPAQLRKESPGFDVPVALGVLALNGYVPPETLDGGVFIGELALDGSIRPVRGVLAVAHMALVMGFRFLVVPLDNAQEAALVQNLEIRPVAHITELVEKLAGRQDWAVQPPTRMEVSARDALDFADVAGQEQAKRALEIAAAGGHNVLMTGPPGSGKSMLAKRLPGILPPMSLDEALETTKIYSVAGLLDQMGLVRTRPFRAPHHTITEPGLVGGGPGPRPGEVSLAHNGILFLDELLEFRRQVLETLRQPLEDRKVTVTRARGSITFPASFQVVAAMNPCPCGHLGDPRHECTCSINAIRRYRARLSGPLLDRFDIQLDVPPVEFTQWRSRGGGETSATVRQRVIRAREIQLERFAGTPVRANAGMGPGEVSSFCVLDSRGEALLERAVSAMGLSGRAVERLLKVSRTIADLEGSESIAPGHLAEAVSYRALDASQV